MGTNGHWWEHISWWPPKEVERRPDTGDPEKPERSQKRQRRPRKGKKGAKKGQKEPTRAAKKALQVQKKECSYALIEM